MAHADEMKRVDRRTICTVQLWSGFRALMNSRVPSEEYLLYNLIVTRSHTTAYSDGTRGDLIHPLG